MLLLFIAAGAHIDGIGTNTTVPSDFTTGNNALAPSTRHLNLHVGV